MKLQFSRDQGKGMPGRGLRPDARRTMMNVHLIARR